MRLPGYSLIYVLFLLTMLAMILAGMLTLHYYTRRESIEWMGRAETEQNVKSAITLLKDPSFLIPEAQPITLSLFNGINDSVTVCRKRWGCFDLLSASARFKCFRVTRMALCGSYRHRKSQPALLLGGSIKPLCLCGNTLLKGFVRVPESGVKAASMGGVYYKRTSLVEGTIDASNRPLPYIDSRYLHLQPGELLRNNGQLSRVVRLTTTIICDTIIQSFQESTLILSATGNIRLEKCLIRGNVMVLCDSTIFVGSTASIADAILCAEKIIIEPRFKGTGQFIATDTLRCGHSCTFPVPSVLAVINKAVNPVPFIFIDQNCRIGGTVLAYSLKSIKPYTSIGMISEHTRIVGSLYSNCEISLEGEIFGNVITSGFLVRNPVSTYQNYLVDAVIDYSRQPDYYTGIDYTATGTTLEIIKWLQ